MGWFSRGGSDPLDAQHVIDEAHAAGAAAPTANAPLPAGAASFRMTVDDVFVIKGRGAVATGTVAGQVSVGQAVSVLRGGAPLLRSRVTALEAFRRTLSVANTGDTVGVLLEKSVSDLRRGDLLVGET